jgi:hypothetical protein
MYMYTYTGIQCINGNMGRKIAIRTVVHGVNILFRDLASPTCDANTEPIGERVNPMSRSDKPLWHTFLSLLQYRLLNISITQCGLFTTLQSLRQLLWYVFLVRRGL